MKIISWLFRNWAVIVLGLGVIGFIRYRQTMNMMHERAKFTLGTIDGWYQTAKSGRRFKFAFDVAGTQYGGSSGWRSGMNEADGSPCLVEYDSLDPQQNVGHFAVAIPDSIRRPPANGWRVPPFPVPAWYLDHGREK
jgi:hypothetical protein